MKYNVSVQPNNACSFTVKNSVVPMYGQDAFIMGFEVDIAEDIPDNSDIEVLVYPSTESDVLERKVDLNTWKVATG